MAEKLDIYNRNKEKTGRIIERKDEEIFHENEFVIAVQCWIINSKNEILLTRRNLNKTSGGRWEATSGLVQSGENSIQGIKRELKEEIGLEIEDKDLTLFKTVVEEKTIRDIYVIKKDIEIKDLKFADQEVIDAKFVKIEELEKMIDNGESFEWFRWFLTDYYKLIQKV